MARAGQKPRAAIDPLSEVPENAVMKRTVVLVLLVLSMTLLAAQASTGAANGVVVFFEGDVRINGQPTDIGALVGARALVETGPASNCEIVFDRKNAVRVSQNAVATLDFTGPIKQVYLKKGGLTSVLRKLVRVAGSDSFRVTTPTVVAGVRGTSFCIWADDDSTYVCACNGSVHAVDAAGSNEQSLSAAHHVARNYVRQGGSIIVSPAGVEHHSDASVESLAARIEETLDWSTPD
jgi:hypothetical protein